MKKVLITGAFRFPDGDAAAIRVLSIGKMFSAIGLNVEFLGWQHGPSKSFYENYIYYSAGEFREKKTSRLKRVFGFIFRGHKTLKWILNKKNYDVIVAYNPTVYFSCGLLLLRKIKKFKLILDSTEWYENEHLVGGKYGLAALENSIRMNLIYPLFNNIICISSYLERHFKNNPNVIKIYPVVFNQPNLYGKVDINHSDALNIIYAGSAGKKDLLVPLIAAIPKIIKEIKKPLSLHIVGAEWSALSKQLIDAGYYSKKFTENIRLYGVIKRKNVLDIYRKCHFSVLLREDRRYALAGFPTKAVESWSEGCPIIMNQVGDVAGIATDMEDSIFVDKNNIEEDLSGKLNFIISNNLYNRMSKKCTDNVANFFTVESYLEDFKVFVRRLN